jgi:hypothetical protein
VEFEHEVKSGLSLDIVVAQGAAILKLLAFEDYALLIRDAIRFLDISLEVLNGVAKFREGDDFFC